MKHRKSAAAADRSQDAESGKHSGPLARQTFCFILPRNVNKLAKWIDRGWRSWPTTVLLILVCLASAVWALWVTPSPGVAIGILGAVAAVMSLRPEMHPFEKAAWIVIVTTLLIAEMHSIRENDRTIARERKAQQDKLETLNNESQTIISGLRATLGDVDKTLKQTQLHAAIRFDRFEFEPNPTKPFAAGVLYHFNYHYTNSGSLPAENIKMMARIYIGRADDKQTQIGLARRFAKDWQSGTPQTAVTIAPGVSPFGSVDRTLTDKELTELNDFGTFYLFVRFEYSDENGRSGTDACSAFQRNSVTEVATNILHACYVFEDFRYPVERK